MLPSAAATGRRSYRQGARADATETLRSRILDALLEAMQIEDYDLITLNALAESAGTTRQTIIRFFGGKDGVLIELFQRFDKQVADNRFQAAGGNLALLARSVVEDLERHGDLVLRLLRQEGRVPCIKERFAESRRHHLAALRLGLAPLLERLEVGAAETALLQARAVTDTLFWNVLRNDMKLDPAITEATILDLLRRIFVAALPDPP